MSYSVRSIFYSKPYPDAALPSQVKLVAWIEKTLGVVFTGKTLGEMSTFIAENKPFADEVDGKKKKHEGDE